MPYTTCQAHERFRKLNPTIQSVGLDTDNGRVIKAKQYANICTFIHGGFAKIPKDTTILRMFNIFRQGYSENDLEKVYDGLRRRLTRDCLILEGTSNPTGSLFITHVYIFRHESKEIVHDGLVFSTNFHHELNLNPLKLQAFLPLDLLHKMHDKEHPMAQFMHDWNLVHTILNKQIYNGNRKQIWRQCGRYLRKVNGWNVFTYPRMMIIRY
eukprot:m.10159 g.10159  ORF g.10159 m.10159 type:complete len:211 (-) comp4209_c2_seq1:71-703(-)